VSDILRTETLFIIVVLSLLRVVTILLIFIVICIRKLFSSS